MNEFKHDMMMTTMNRKGSINQSHKIIEGIFDLCDLSTDIYLSANDTLIISHS